MRVSSVSSGFYEQRTVEIHPLDRLLELEGTDRSAILYLGYMEVMLQIPDKGYNENALLLLVLTMTYAEKVSVMVGSTNIDMAMNAIMKGELARVMVTWRQANLSAVMSGSLQLFHECTRGSGILAEVVPPLQPRTLGSSTWMISRGTSTPQRITIPPFETVNVHDKTIARAVYVGSCAYRVSEGSPATQICCAKHYIWRLHFGSS